MTEEEKAMITELYREVIGNEKTRSPGLHARLFEIERRMDKTEDRQHQILNWIKGAVVGIILSATLFGYLSLKEVFNLIK